MSKTAKNATIVRLTPETKEFLHAIGFPEIPSKANYVMFWDGEAQFVEDISSELKMNILSNVLLVNYDTGFDIEME